MTKISNDVRHYLLMDRLQSSEFPKNIEKKAETVAELTLTELILKLSDSLREKAKTPPGERHLSRRWGRIGPQFPQRGFGGRTLHRR